MARKDYCKYCDEEIMTVDGDCPLCGEKVGIPDSKKISVNDGDSNE